MNTIWRNLLWREWHEHKWKLASLTAIMLAMQATAIWGDPQLVTLGAPIAGFFAIIPLAVFVAMNAAAGERTAGTLAFARSLPADRSLLGASKLAAGAATLLASIVLASLLPLVWLMVLNWTGHSEHESPFKGAGQFEALVLSGVLSTGVAMSCFMWTVALGVNRATEIRAGLSGAALLLIAFLFRAIDDRFRATPDPTLAIRLLGRCNEIGPLGLTLLFNPLVSPWRVVFSQLATYAVLFAWSIHQYGRTETIGRRSSEAGDSCSDIKRGTQPKAIRPAWRTAGAAIAWKQAREAAPFCLVGALLIVGFAGWLSMLDAQRGEFAEALSVAGITVAMLAGLLVGIGTFIGELQPRMMDFWRSRPIEPAFWFWTKYFTGLAAISLFLATPIVASGREGVFMALVFLPWLATVYSLAVCLTCLVRHSFYAGVLSFTLALFLFVLSAIHKEWLNAVSYLVVFHRARNLAPGDWLLSVYAPYLAIMAFAAASIAFAAWLAVKRDFGSQPVSRIGRALRAKP
jgi:ABC-type transport system involved in multi-copper enzyme maturation permease subunit